MLNHAIMPSHPAICSVRAQLQVLFYRKGIYYINNHTQTVNLLIICCTLHDKSETGESFTLFFLTIKTIGWIHGSGTIAHPLPSR